MHQGIQGKIRERTSGGRFTMKRRFIAIAIASAALLILFAVIAVPLFTSAYATYASSAQATPTPGASPTGASPTSTGTMNTINGLVNISVVGSTALLLNKQGVTIAVDANPSDVQIVPSTPATLQSAPHGSLRAGDLVATNIGNTGGGNTLVSFPARVGPGHQFNSTTTSFSGLAKEAFNTKSGTLWVTNFSHNTVEIFRSDGTYLSVVKSTLFHQPWGIAFNNGIPVPQEHSFGSFFVANAGDGTIDRIDIISINGIASFKVSRIAQLFYKYGTKAKISLTWAATFTIRNQHYNDVLLAVDPLMNRIVAFPDSTTIQTTSTQGITLFAGRPLNNPGGITLNPFNNDLLVVNLNDNNLLELDANAGTVVGTRLVDNVPVNLQTGNGSALFGVAAGKDPAGNLVIYFTDDNTNTIDMLSI